MGALFALLIARATAALKHRATIYGLMAVAGLIFIFSGAYALNAAYVMLMFRYGAVAASLVVAGCLAMAAIGCLIAARIMSIPASETADAKLSRLASSYSPPHIRVSEVAAAGAGLGAVVVALFMVPRLWRRSRRHL